MRNSANYVGYEGYKSSYNHDAGTIQEQFAHQIKALLFHSKNKPWALKSL